MEKKLFSAIASALFVMIWLSPIIGKIFSKPFVYEIIYNKGTIEENNVDTVYIDNIYADGKGVLSVEKSDNIEHNDEKGSYYWYGDQEEAKLSICVRNIDALSFRVGYYAKEAGVVSDDTNISILFGGKKEFYKISNFDDYGVQEIEYRRGEKAVSEYLGEIVIFVVIFCSIFLYWPRLNEKFKNPLIYVLLFSAAVKKYYGMLYPAYVYYETGDSPTYVIESLSELSWSHRMPVYQLFIWMIRKILGKNIEESVLFTTVANLQSF